MTASVYDNVDDRPDPGLAPVALVAAAIVLVAATAVVTLLDMAFGFTVHVASRNVPVSWIAVGWLAWSLVAILTGRGKGRHALVGMAVIITAGIVFTFAMTAIFGGPFLHLV